MKNMYPEYIAIVGEMNSFFSMFNMFTQFIIIFQYFLQ